MKLTSIMLSLFVFGFAHGQDAEWEKLPGEYSLKLPGCVHSRRPGGQNPGRSFRPISSLLRITKTPTPASVAVQKGESAQEPRPGLLVEAQIDGVTSSAQIGFIGAPAPHSVPISAPGASTCELTYRSNHATESWNPLYSLSAYVNQANPRCTVDADRFNVTESIRILRQADNGIVVFVERDIFGGAHQGFECHYKLERAFR